MKYIKASLCSLVTFCCLSYIHSAEDLDPLFAELKRTKSVEADITISETERREAIDKGFEDIESKIFLGSPLPETLKKLIRETGNLGVSVEILSPIRGITSPLYNGIREGQEKQIPFDWVVFGKLTESEYFCINRLNSKIARFLVFPEAKPFKKEDTYPNLKEWINKILLRKK